MKDTWDESSQKAHWRNRPAGKPFFAVFNHQVTHESQLFPQNITKYQPLAAPTDPKQIQLPAYHPDLPEFRTDWANYIDQMARLDEQAGKLLAQLDNEAFFVKCRAFSAHSVEISNHGLTAVAITYRPFGPRSRMHHWIPGDFNKTSSTHSVKCVP